MPYVVNTELGAGTAQARGYKNLEPGDVADAIVDALKHRVVDVWVPAQPPHPPPHARSCRAARARASPARSRPTASSTGADKNARARLRAARGPLRAGLEPGEEPRQLTS